MIKDIYRGSNDEPYVSFATANKYHFNTLEARFKKPEQDKLADFRTLSQIVLSCNGAEVIKDSIGLNNYAIYERLFLLVVSHEYLRHF